MTEPSDDATVDVSPEQLAEIRRTAAEQRAANDAADRELDQLSGDTHNEATTTVAPEALREIREKARALREAEDGPEAEEDDYDDTVVMLDSGLLDADNASATPDPDPQPAAVSQSSRESDDSELPVWAPPPRLKSESHEVATLVEPEEQQERPGIPLWAAFAAVLAAIVVTVVILLLVSNDDPSDAIEQTAIILGL